MLGLCPAYVPRRSSREMTVKIFQKLWDFQILDFEVFLPIPMSQSNLLIWIPDKFTLLIWCFLASSHPKVSASTIQSHPMKLPHSNKVVSYLMNKIHLTRIRGWTRSEASSLLLDNHLVSVNWPFPRCLLSPSKLLPRFQVQKKAFSRLEFQVPLCNGK